MQKWNLVIDVAACTNCNNCVVATQDEYAGNRFPDYSAPGARNAKLVDVTRHVRGSGSMVDVHYVPRMCNHCDAAPCVAAGGGAVRKRPDGIVIIDPERSKGRRDLVDACPYGAIVWNDEEQLPQNWIFDAHLLDAGWKEPRAAHVCPTRAITAMKIGDREMEELARKEGLDVLQGELGSRPRVYYRNLSMVMTGFIGGNVTAAGENVEDVEVSLLQAGNRIADSRTDAFGDFRFDGIVRGSEGYLVRASREDLGSREVVVEGGVDQSLVIDLALG